MTYAELLLKLVEDGEQTVQALQSLQQYTAGFVNQNAPIHNAVHEGLTEALAVLQPQQQEA